MSDKLGIVAGGGALPRQLAEAARLSGRDVFILAFPGQTPAETPIGYEHAWVPLGSAARAISVLRENGVRDLVLIGGMRRPSLSELRPDWRAARMFARIGLSGLGDDGLLRAIRDELETEGFRLLGIDDLLRDILMPVGCLTPIEPDRGAREDMSLGFQVARALGRLDVGQAVVVQQGLVLGVEAIEGTDALIERCRDLSRDGPGGVLVKVRKPQQDRRLDLPTIGPETVRRAARAGLRGLAIEAGEALLVDREVVLALAAEHALFIIGVESAEIDAWTDAG